jgi:hypothetical protein
MGVGRSFLATRSAVTPDRELKDLEARLKRGAELGDEVALRTVRERAEELEGQLPGHFAFFFGDDKRGRARGLKEAAVSHLNMLRRRGLLYTPPPPAKPSEKRTLPRKKDAIPLYIDTHALLTLLAARRDGFSIVETRTVGSERRLEATKSLGFKFEIAPVGFLNLGPSGSVSDSRQEGETQSSSREVFQTEGSLFYQLLDSLREDEITRVDDDTWEEVADFDFVEVHARLGPNPWVEYLTAQRRLVDIAEPLADLTGGRGKKERAHATKRMAAYRGFLDTALAALDHGGPLPLLGQVQLSSVNQLVGQPTPRVVVPVFPEYVRDPSLAELTRGVVVVVGKVREKLDISPTHSGNAAAEAPGEVDKEWARAVIPLVPSALLGALAEKGLETLFVAAEELSAEVRRSVALVDPALDSPPIVRGPALEVVPIAILASRLVRSRGEDARPSPAAGRFVPPQSPTQFR